MSVGFSVNFGNTVHHLRFSQTCKMSLSVLQTQAFQEKLCTIEFVPRLCKQGLKRQYNSIHVWLEFGIAR